MGRKAKIDTSEDVTFKEAVGLPANAHAKKLAKQKKLQDKLESTKGSFYTRNGNKILKMTVKSSGTYVIYIGNMKRHQDALNTKIAGWKKDGQWVGADSVEDKIKELQSSKDLAEF